MAVQFSPKELVGVRFLHRPQFRTQWKTASDSKQTALLTWRNRRTFRFSVLTETKRYTVLVEEDILHRPQWFTRTARKLSEYFIIAWRWRNRKPDRDGGRQGRANFHQKITPDRKCTHVSSYTRPQWKIQRKLFFCWAIVSKLLCLRGGIEELFVF